VKICPSCEAELRDSVIRCTTCGTPQTGAPVEDVRPGTAMAAGVVGRGAAAPARPPSPAPTSTATAEPAVAPTSPSPGSTPTARSASTWAPPATTTSWHGTPTRSNGPGSAIAPDLRSRRALPDLGRRSNRPDPLLLVAGVVAAGAAYLAWAAIPVRWMQITIANSQDGGSATTLGTATFKASDAMVGTLAQMVLAVVVVSAALWLFFGLQRGWNMPWFSNPAIAIAATIAGIGGTIVSSMLWFGWRDAVFNVASKYGETQQSLEAFLEDPDNQPIITMHRLAGPGRFGEMLVVALLASCVAWWAYRKRLG
jgi:hypothetical protein